MTAPLVHLLLQLLAELVYPLLQPLPALLRGQVAEVLQGRSLEERERGGEHSAFPTVGVTSSGHAGLAGVVAHATHCCGHVQ